MTHVQLATDCTIIVIVYLTSTVLRPDDASSILYRNVCQECMFIIQEYFLTSRVVLASELSWGHPCTWGVKKKDAKKSFPRESA